MKRKLKEQSEVPYPFCIDIFSFGKWFENAKAVLNIFVEVDAYCCIGQHEPL